MQRINILLVLLLFRTLAVIGKPTNKYKDKDGLCPSRPGPCRSLDVANECFLDSECNGTKKCCPSNCVWKCVDAVTSNITDCMGPVDLAFLVDVSGSLGPSGFSNLIAFLKKAISLFEIGADSTHVAVISFANNAHVVFDFKSLKGDNLTESAVLEQVDGIEGTNGLTRIDKALKLAATDVFSTKGGMRPNQKRLLVLLSDGYHQNAPGIDNLQVASRPLKKNKVHVYTGGIGNNIDIAQLLDAASDECSVFRILDMNDVLSFVRDIAKQSCKGNRIEPDPSEADEC